MSVLETLYRTSSGLFLKSTNVTFDIVLKGNLPTEIFGNEAFILHSLANLIHNSAKHFSLAKNFRENSQSREA
jgi:hypothetical protein